MLRKHYILHKAATVVYKMTRKDSFNPYHFNDEQIDTFKDIFSQFDKDGDGTLATKYVGTIMRTLGQSPTEAELRQIIMQVDADKSGEMDFSEFVMMMANHMKEETDTKEEICKAFKVFDEKGCGSIPVEDLRCVLTTLGEALTEEEMDELLKKADLNKDGKVRYEEFVSKMMTTDTKTVVVEEGQKESKN